MQFTIADYNHNYITERHLTRTSQPQTDPTPIREWPRTRNNATHFAQKCKEIIEYSTVSRPHSVPRLATVLALGSTLAYPADASALLVNSAKA